MRKGFLLARAAMKKSRSTLLSQQKPFAVSNTKRVDAREDSRGFEQLDHKTLSNYARLKPTDIAAGTDIRRVESCRRVINALF